MYDFEENVCCKLKLSTGFLSLGRNDTWGWISLCWEGGAFVRCFRGYLARITGLYPPDTSRETILHPSQSWETPECLQTLTNVLYGKGDAELSLVGNHWFSPIPDDLWHILLLTALLSQRVHPLITLESCPTQGPALTIIFLSVLQLILK